MAPLPNWQPMNDRDSTWNLDENPDAMEHAKRWTLELIDRWADKATWMVPRSMSIYVADKTTKTLEKRAGLPEPSIKRVFEALGWTVKGEA